MNKQEAIINLSVLFNRGLSTEAETQYFNSKNHDETVKEFQDYIQKSVHLLGNPKMSVTQALNDHGVDLLIEFPNLTKVGFQIKSHFDVTEDQFALKVKAQLTDSRFHGLDKWFLLICSPLEDDKKDYRSKISHLINEFSGYKTTYHVVYNPQHCTNVLRQPLMTQNEFNALKNQYVLGEIDWAEILRELKHEKAAPKAEGYISRLEKHSSSFITSCKSFAKYLGYKPSEEETCLEDLEELYNLLKKLSKKSREFLYVVLSKYTRRSGFRDQILTPCKHIENLLGLEISQVRDEVNILEEHRIASFDEEDGVWYIVINRVNPNYNILEQVKKFCDQEGKPLQEIIVNLDFSHFD